MVTVFPTSRAEINSTYPSLRSINLVDCPRLKSFCETGLPSNLKHLEIWDWPVLFINGINWDLQILSSLQSLDLRGCEFEGPVDSFPEERLLPSTLTSLKIRFCNNLKTLNGKSFQHLTFPQRLQIWFCPELQCLPEEGLPLSLIHLSIGLCPLLNHRCQRRTGVDWPKIQHIRSISINYKEIWWGNIMHFYPFPFSACSDFLFR